jgi:hypothetical protein
MNEYFSCYLKSTVNLMDKCEWKEIFSTKMRIIVLNKDLISHN